MLTKSQGRDAVTIQSDDISTIKRLILAHPRDELRLIVALREVITDHVSAEMHFRQLQVDELAKDRHEKGMHLAERITAPGL